MEEIDKIILHTLRQIGCDLQEDVIGMGHFTTDLVVEATARCLRLVSPGPDPAPLCLPPSMSARFRVGASLAQACVDLGYKGDIGYQTFLYSTEADIRKVFMFLIEKLPKETEKVVDQPLGAAGLARQLVCQRLRQQLSVPWVPGRCRVRGLQWLDGDAWVREDFCGTQHFSSVTLCLPPKPSAGAGEDTRSPPTLLEQLDRPQLLPSLLALTAHQRANPGLPAEHQEAGRQLLRSVRRDWGALVVPSPMPRVRSLVPPPVARERPSALASNQQHKAIATGRGEKDQDAEGKLEGEEAAVQSLQEEAEVLELRVEQLQLGARSLAARAAQAAEEAQVAQGKLAVQEERFAAHKQTSELLPEAEQNVAKLQGLVEASAARLASLATQWERHRAPLVASYRELREKNSHRVSESQRAAEAVRWVRDKMRDLAEEVRAKEALHRQLSSDHDKLAKDLSRSAYTRRILEIIGNVRKQKGEIERVLGDTRQVQKEINQLTGRLDRSFAVADELIFKDAKREEAARRSYKLLATLHADCADLVTLVQETGATMREIRDLEDQIETENAKNVAANLERITADLRQMKQESASLMAQLKSKS